VIEDCASEYQIVRWRNPLGGIDYMYFKGQVVKARDGSTSTYQKVLADSFNVYDTGETVLNIESDEEWTLVTDNISGDEVEWLREIVGKQVWIGSTFIPFTVTSFNPIYSQVFDPVMKGEITVVPSHKPMNQRG